MPLYHVGGSVLTLLLCGARRATAVTLPRFEAAPMLRLLCEERCTHFFGLETHCAMILEVPGGTAGPSLRVAFVGGRREILEAVRARLCPTIVNRYGLTESSGNTTSTEVADPPEVALTTMGRPLPGLEVRVVDGEIRVRGWGVTRGYLDDPEATRAVFDEDGWLRTGDSGEIDADGRLIFLGRIRDALRVGGENVAAAEIEALVGSHPDVAQVAVVPVPDARLGEVPVAFVELHPGRDAAEAEIIEFCRARAAGFKVPRRIHFVAADAWPLTGSGKIQKRTLRERALA
jgi:fatty-acyl-CoA synthase